MFAGMVILGMSFMSLALINLAAGLKLARARR